MAVLDISVGILLVLGKPSQELLWDILTWSGAVAFPGGGGGSEGASTQVDLIC